MAAKKQASKTSKENKASWYYEKPKLIKYPKVKRIYGAEVVYQPGGTGT